MEMKVIPRSRLRGIKLFDVIFHMILPYYFSLIFFKISRLCFLEYAQYLPESFGQFLVVIELTFFPRPRYSFQVIGESP